MGGEKTPNKTVKNTDKVGRRSGGRPKGSPNKNRLTLHEMAAKLGIDPFEVILHFAKGDWKALGYAGELIEKHSKDCTNYEYVIDPSVRAKMAAEAAGYLWPKLRAVEHSGTVGQQHSGAITISPVKTSELIELLKKVKSE